jgi:hypothetical protein
MAVFKRFDRLPFDVSRAVHDFSTHEFKIVLTNVEPAASATQFSDILEIASGNGYPLGGLPTSVSLVQVADVARVICTDVLVTAVGGTIGPIRYAVLCNVTQTNPDRPVVGYWDRGSSVTLSAGDAVLVDFDPVDGAFVVN